MEEIYKYALTLLKRKNYYIRELIDKLAIKYSINEYPLVIKKLINNGYLNDKKLVYLKINYFINTKMYGEKYILKYYENKKVSLNLINYTLNLFKDDINNNKNIITNNLSNSGFNEDYINNKLISKGYSI